MKTFEQWKETFELPEGCSIRGVETSVLRIAFEAGQDNPDIDRLDKLLDIINGKTIRHQEDISNLWEQSKI